MEHELLELIKVVCPPSLAEDVKAIVKYFYFGN